MVVAKSSKFKQGSVLLQKDSFEAKLRRQAKILLSLQSIVILAGLYFGRTLFFNSELDHKSENVIGAELTASHILLCIEMFLAWGYQANRSANRSKMEHLLNFSPIARKSDQIILGLVPMCEGMLKSISLQYPEIGKKFLEGRLGRKDRELVMDCIQSYFKEHSNEAKKVVNLLTAVHAPQDVIDRFVAKYVPDTLSFRMAQKLARRERKDA